ncbi:MULTISPECIES: hypothetical protein [unclassified Bradyrhizobium]|uniref:hypothetical protein n=2 Tax=unclassified Bradyrhizobium TaxID=2631580 RepID=UPI00339B0050
MQPTEEHEPKIGALIDLRQMSEEHDTEQRATENKGKTPKKQKQVTQDRIRALRGKRNASQAIPIGDLHRNEHHGRSKIVGPFERELLTGMDHQVPKFGQSVQDYKERSCQLNQKKKQVDRS